MKTHNKPKIEQWEKLVQRIVINDDQLSQTVSSIIKNVKQNGDHSLIKYASKFDGVKLNRLAVSAEEINTAIKLVPQKLKDAIQVAYNNILIFHEAQVIQEEVIETTPVLNAGENQSLLKK